jgi:chemotaxis signal transduction protein
MATNAIVHFLLARIGSAYWLLDLSVIREIVPAMELAVPRGAAGGFCGVANVRGEVVPVFDAMKRGSTLGATQLILITRGDAGRWVGLLVDDVAEIVELPVESVVEHPAGRGRTMRTVNLHGSVLTVLEPSEVVDAA